METVKWKDEAKVVHVGDGPEYVQRILVNIAILCAGGSSEESADLIALKRDRAVLESVESASEVEAFVVTEEKVFDTAASEIGLRADINAAAQLDGVTGPSDGLSAIADAEGGTSFDVEWVNGSDVGRIDGGSDACREHAEKQTRSH